MLVPVTFNNHSKSPSSTSIQKLPLSLAKISHDEIVLIDLQGALEIDSSQPSEHDAKLIGTLNIDKDLKRPTLQIGHHVIEGKLVNLPKPLAVLHRSQVPAHVSESQWTEEDDRRIEDVMMNGVERTVGFKTHSSASTVQWNTLAIVQRKILFSKRPMPVVGRPTET